MPEHGSIEEEHDVKSYHRLAARAEKEEHASGQDEPERNLRRMLG